MVKTLVAALMLVSSLALAQAAKKSSPGRTEITFEPDLVDGTGQAPDVELVAHAERPKHGSLLKTRENFNDKVLESFHQL